MSGTSLDGVDVAIVSFSHEVNNSSDNINEENVFIYNLIAFNTYNYTEKFKEILKKIIKGECKTAEISYMNFALSEVYAEAVRNVCIENGININDIEAVGMHGQTVWHSPEPNDYAGIACSSTLQLGSAPALAQKLGIKVCSDFRSADVAVGGQGAPIVPILDYHFFRSQEHNIIMLNIGGIANITFLPKNCKKNEVIAFDTGPGNCLIDFYTKEYFGKDYDQDGEIASQGMLIEDVFGFLRGLEYIQRKPPKSTGREFFNESLFNGFDFENFKKEDIIRTMTEFTAWSIADSIKLQTSEKSRIIVSGGGVHNAFLLNLLKNYLSDDEVINSNDLGLSADAKEAICFGFLAFLLLNGQTGNICSVTGASREVLLGTISMP